MGPLVLCNVVVMAQVHNLFTRVNIILGNQRQEMYAYDYMQLLQETRGSGDGKH